MSSSLDPSLDWSKSNPWATHLQENNDDAIDYFQHDCPTNVLGGHCPASAQAPEHVKASHGRRRHTIPCVPQAQVIEIERNAGQIIVVVIPPSHSTQNVRFGRAGNVNLGSNYGEIYQHETEDSWRGCKGDYGHDGCTRRLRDNCIPYVYPGSEPAADTYPLPSSHPMGAMERVEDSLTPSRGRKKGVWTGIARLFRRP
ncbi:hypothetical protein D9611_010773 [Ephemerocybe angulata]|uniref:Uncharacterized protein n=1 Tax=Ephemerocybe angulata TaxID=980116 RepID=A0A8H5F1V3_9AGAR|nr:hypothetical protein D9611_010773 [Tulosesus angulatus]